MLACINKHLLALVVLGAGLQALVKVSVCVFLDANCTSSAFCVFPAAVDGQAVLGHLRASATARAKLGHNQRGGSGDHLCVSNELAALGFLGGFALAFVHGLAIRTD